MSFRQAGRIRYYEFDSFKKEGVFHAVVTRNEGISPAPWNSLNFGGSGGDDRNRVIENRRIAFEALKINSDSIFNVWQVHGNQVVCADGPRVGIPHQKADAILSNCPNTRLLMLFADCVPVLLFDPVHKVIGIVHAGWRGTLLKTTLEAIMKMQMCYDTRPKDILAAIGPSIGPDHYSVGDDMIRLFLDAFGADAYKFIHTHNDAVKLNLWESNRYLLAQTGVKQIEIAEICTACHLDDWYSHRTENGITGRFGVVIGLCS